ncbi:MAG TPA: DeoR/GlpR family DNA-binding transcription regulator [Coriobacteriia bacterium]|nr:DeoR/GlpR family DNA-binding transcription regulator [Coriobacteriia bacterium]
MDLLRSDEVSYIDELVEATGASPSTIRRDIVSMETSGLVTALRAGAVKANERLLELPASTKALINKNEKAKIAAAAARLVEDGDTIYIDSGTTALQMMQFLQNCRIHVVTSNTHVLAVAHDPKIRITMLAGEFLNDTGSVAGSLTERLLGDFFFDKSFLGASGCSGRAGVNTFDIREATKKRIVHQNSRDCYVLLDSTKFGTSTLCKALEISECRLITDEYHELLAQAKSYIIA